MDTAERREKAAAVPPNPIPSSSPAFGTPAHPIHPRRVTAIRAPPALQPVSKATVLPVLLPPATLRPLAFRTFTKKHNITLTSSALQALATFIGKHCGSGWREEGLAEKVLEEVAKSWKKSGGQVIVEGDNETLKGILRTLEGSMVGGRIVQGSTLSRQSSFNFGSETNGLPSRPGPDSSASFGMSDLDVADDDEDEQSKDPRDWLKVIGAFEQPHMVYNVTQKHFDKSTTKPTFFPDPSHKTQLFRQRYHIVHQRILRNETFQAPTFSTTRSATLIRAGSVAAAQPNSITPIANLLGRSGSTHLLLGMLTVSPTGALSLSDLTGTIALDIQHARPIPETGAYFAPGMIVLVEGSYEEDSGVSSTLGGTGGIGGTIGGKFLAFSVGHPPCERRTATLGGTDDVDKSAINGPAFGWTDFLGVGSQRATGSRMNKMASKLLDPTQPQNIIIASDVHLDVPATMMALRTLLRTNTPDPSAPQPNYPLAIILMGNFLSKPCLTSTPGTSSIEYKEHFDLLASVLSEFPLLIAHTSLIFIPGDNDPWPSAFLAGAANPLPRKPIPPLFTTRVRRAVAEANRTVWGNGKIKGKEGEVIWTSNPCRISLFGIKCELAFLRDDMTTRLQRTSLRFPKPNDEDEHDNDIYSPHPTSPHDQNTTSLSSLSHTHSMDLDPIPQPPQPPQTTTTTTTTTPDPKSTLPKSLTRTLLSQSHLSPFPISLRPVHWSFAHTLNLYPLPSCLVLADSGAPAFVLKYCGCTVLNPGSLVEGRRGERARWVEFEVRGGGGSVRVV